MNDEQRTEQTLRDFYIDDQSQMHDRDALMRDLLDTVHETPQKRRRRWWPFRRHAALTSPLPSRELQPDLTTVTANGQTATSSGSRPAHLGGIAVAFAAVALALFGGFLLLGLLGPESPETLPGALSSAAPNTTPAPSETPMDLKTPIATAIAVATMAPGTGVAALEPEFIAEQVEPGVERIISDGADFDTSTLPDDIAYAFEDIALSPNGDVFVAAYRYHTETGRTEGPFVIELGTPGEFGTIEGFPADFEKIIVNADGELVVSAPSGIKRLDGETWVDSPGSVAVQTGGGTIWFAEPGDLGKIGPGAPTDHRGGVLTLSADYAGYVLGDEVGYRFVKDGPPTHSVNGVVVSGDLPPASDFEGSEAALEGLVPDPRFDFEEDEDGDEEPVALPEAALPVEAALNEAASSFGVSETWVGFAGTLGEFLDSDPENEEMAEIQARMRETLESLGVDGHAVRNYYMGAAEGLLEGMLDIYEGADPETLAEVMHPDNRPFMIDADAPTDTRAEELSYGGQTVYVHWNQGVPMYFYIEDDRVVSIFNNEPDMTRYEAAADAFFTALLGAAD